MKVEKKPLFHYKITKHQIKKTFYSTLQDKNISRCLFLRTKLSMRDHTSPRILRRCSLLCGSIQTERAGSLPSNLPCPFFACSSSKIDSKENRKGRRTGCVHRKATAEVDQNSHIRFGFPSWVPGSEARVRWWVPRQRSRFPLHPAQSRTSPTNLPPLVSAELCPAQGFVHGVSGKPTARSSPPALGSRGLHEPTACSGS